MIKTSPRLDRNRAWDHQVGQPNWTEPEPNKIERARARRCSPPDPHAVSTRVAGGFLVQIMSGKAALKWIRYVLKARGQNIALDSGTHLLYPSSSSPPARQRRGTFISVNLSHRMYSSISFEKSSPPQNRQLITY